MKKTRMKKAPILILLLLVLTHCKNNSKQEAVQKPEPPKPVYFNMDNVILAAVQDTATGLWGYIDQSGKYVITPQFQKANCFRFNRAPAKANNSWGLINGKGEFVVSNIEYDEFDYYKDGMYKSKREHSGFSFIDTSGHVVISFGDNSNIVEYRFAKGIIETYNYNTQKTEYYDLKKNLLANPDTSCFSMKDTTATFGEIPSGLAKVQIRGNSREGDADDNRVRYTYIDNNGKHINQIFDNAGDFHYGLAPVRDRGYHTINNYTGIVGYHDGDCGFIDINGVYVIPPKFRDANIFQCAGFNCQNASFNTPKNEQDSLKSMGSENAVSKPIVDATKERTHVKIDATVLIVVASKAYLYDKPNESYKTKSYLVTGESVEVLKLEGNFVYTGRTGNGDITHVWIKKDDLVSPEKYNPE
jgi:WG containing repeat